MTRKERQIIKNAIDLFLDDDPDKWVDAIDQLCLLVYGKKWSDTLPTGKPINIRDLLSKQTLSSEEEYNDHHSQ